MLVILGPALLTVALHQRILAGELLELRGGHQPGVLEDHRLVGGARDAEQRTHLRVGQLTSPEGVIDQGEVGELAGDAYALARRDEVPADSPGEPVRARQRALRVPATPPIEVTQVGEQAMGRRIEVRGVLGDPFPQLLELSIHGRCIARASDTDTSC